MDPRTRRFGLSFVVIAALTLSLAAGCEAERIPATIACNSACEVASACGETNCWNNCMQVSSSLETLASCTSCLTAAGSDCEWRARCFASCDGRALESPECAGLCTGVVAECPGGASCMDQCVAWDVQTRNSCLQCVELSGLDCNAWNQCAVCRAGAPVPGTPTGGGDEK